MVHPERASGKAAIEAGAEKPATLPVNPDGIPAELRKRPQWVCWRWEQRAEKKTGQLKWTKPPVNPRTGRHASSTDPATWGTFEQALAAYRAGDADGVGFVITEPYTGLDLDDCRDPRTGAIAPWAAELLAECGGCQEVSPSGTGLKGLARGRKPGKECGPKEYGTGSVEMYDERKYFALTGHALGDVPVNLPDRQEQIASVYRCVFESQRTQAEGGKPAERPTGNGRPGRSVFRWTARSKAWQKPYHELTDEELLELAGEARDGDKFRALWGGDTGGHDCDDSRADAALCEILAFWCRKDKARIDRLFRRSGLMRPKWDERHYGDGRTYGQGTLDYAIGLCSEVYDGPPPEDGQAVEPGPGAQGDRRGPVAGATATEAEQGEPHLTDTGNAARLVRRHGRDLRYCHPWGRWLVWDGRRWAPDATAEAVRRVKETALWFYGWTVEQIEALVRAGGEGDE
jgi:putative DNA primase/helicase